MKSALLVFAGALILVLVSAGTAPAAEAAAESPTFNTEVAPIIFDNCVACHRSGQVAPMSLTSYKETRPWARAIKDKVLAREMPPWYADSRFGRFRNARNLSQDEIDTLVAWADGGAPEGTGLVPALPDFPEGWSHPDREPDYVIDQAVEVALPANGEIPYMRIWEKVPFEEDKFVEALQMRPSNAAAVHHAGAYIRPLPPGTRLGEKPAYRGGPLIPAPVPIDENETAEARRERQAATVRALGTELLLFYVPGGGFQQFRPGVGKRIRADRYVVFDMHYTATGKPETDRSSVGLWLQKTPAHHEVVTHFGAETHIVETAERLSEEAGATRVETGSGTGPALPTIPAQAANFKVTGINAVTDDLTLYGMWPHMHFRGKDMTYVVTFPDGREQVLLNVPNYDFNWQVQYELEEPVHIPAGSTIKVIGHLDNSINNRYNPAPDTEVYWGEQSWDEMFVGFMEYSIDKRSLKTKPETEEDGQ